MAHLSQDPVLVESFLKGEDIHARTAQEVFGMNAMMNPQEFRRHAKVINFGIMYGLSAFGLAQSLKITRKEAQQFIDNYFKKYQGVKTWIDQTLAEVYEAGYVRTLSDAFDPSLRFVVRTTILEALLNEQPSTLRFKERRPI